MLCGFRVAAVEHLVQVVARDDPHVEPLLFVVGVERVDAGELRIGRIQVADMTDRLAAALTSEDFEDQGSTRSALRVSASSTPRRRHS